MSGIGFYVALLICIVVALIGGEIWARRRDR